MRISLIRPALAVALPLFIFPVLVLTSRGHAADLNKYATVRLKADLSQLTDNQRKMLPLLIEASEAMDEIFWRESFGDKQAGLREIVDPKERRFFQINYGPWDRLDGNKPFVSGVKVKPLGAQFYPADMTKEELERYVQEHPNEAKSLRGLYTIVRRGEQGKLKTIPYHEYFAKPTGLAAQRLKRAADFADNPKLRAYLLSRARALRTSEYRDSDMLWMDMKDNQVDVVIGPIETYEDQLFGYKAAHESYVLIKDMAWSQRLAKYAAILPRLQKNLPVPAKYRQETPGRNSDLNAYDVIYYAGDCNAGSKTIAINLPNDEQVQLSKGTRRLQLKNAMRAKFDRILHPISEVLLVPSQRKHVTFDAFFANTMFHEVAHGLGIKHTINGRGPVRQALRDQSAALEEGKADVLGLFMITWLHENKELTDGDLMDNYVTFMASVFRSIRFGASSAHGRANLLRFNYFRELGAFQRDDGGLYRVDPQKMRQAVESLSRKILILQGDGDYEGAVDVMKAQGAMGLTLKADLERVSRAGVPVDIVFEQGKAVLGLQ